MAKYLVIVESPTKAKTINGILGRNYEVVSSMGHLIDLAENRLSVDVEAGFTPHYRIISGKEKLLAQIKKKTKDKEVVYIATDPDREGEAIGWHIKEHLSKDTKAFGRVIFHEITESAIKEAFAHPKDLDLRMVNAQIARRVLDRIVGYNLSPLLWKKVVRGLSAGRVQSVALKFIVDRERQIKNFIPKTTYGVETTVCVDGQTFKARLKRYHGKKAIFDTKEEALRSIEEAKRQGFFVKDIITKESKRKPPAPYTTSLLQQDAFNKLGFSSQKTMLLAQKLYEGISLKGTMTGLITYMRTDSFQISPKARLEAKEFIQRVFGKDYIPLKDHYYKEKKVAQLAHEAIRPTSAYRQTNDIRDSLSDDEAKLYDLIWKRFISSIMKEALFENTKVILTNQGGSLEFIAEASRMLFDGYLRIQGREVEDVVLPDLKKQDAVDIRDLGVTEHTTKPPPHFNDASLVKLLEEKGIGRPSTYAPTIYTLLLRNYLRREGGYLAPTELGIKVSDLLVEHFPEVIDEEFTARMEEELDSVEEGKMKWKKVLEDFYPSFKEAVEKATRLIKKDVEFVQKNCPSCGRPLVVKWSRRGRFLSCSAFPECRHAESILTPVSCPECKEGKLIERRNKRGQFFYGCSRFPHCRYTTRQLPTDKAVEKS